jgi:transposase-like protein
MARRGRRKFTDEYKAEVVALVRSSGKGIASNQPRPRPDRDGRSRVGAAGRGGRRHAQRIEQRGTRGVDASSPPGARARRRRTILKKAATFFAKEIR